MKTWLLFGFAVLLMVVSGMPMAHAQALYLVSVNLAEPVQRDWMLRQEITLPLAQSSSRPTDFHIRVFRGSLDFNKRDMKKAADKDGCIPYSTSILYVQVQGATIHIPKLTEIAWLNIMPGGHPAKQDWVFVFEAGDQPTYSLIRVHKDQVDKYFQHALQVTINPSEEDNQAPVKVVEATLRNYSRRVAAAAAADPSPNNPIPTAVVPTQPCFEVREREHVTASTPSSALEEVALVQPLPCGELAQEHLEINGPGQ